MGLLILLGVGHDDTSAVATTMAEKISNLRLEARHAAVSSRDRVSSWPKWRNLPSGQQ